ncbi:hypothetical protein LPB248_06605 [Flavobacterium sp. LPB0248]|uniref:hypothetical protein n=1 Tax=Flavobacterium sp. LPB0248 TaxID=2614441 RepID=UPI0015A72F90|nr:hypothetical protein [Flavobacterium sp. LPB0248]QLC65959.1 hypothetical protein LPB248_06605 [Flavobacterium sp. LPB0248]
MEKETITLNDFIDNPEHFFIMLRPASKRRNDIHSIEINVQGYSDLFCLIMDLLKAGMLALDGIEGSGENIRDPERYVRSLLRITEMLIPMEEGDLLDMLYQKYLNEKNITESQ